MNKVQLRGTRVAVEKLKKAKNNNSGLFVEPQTEEFYGEIIYSGKENTDSDLAPKRVVYFGSNFSPVRILGRDLCVMDEDNVLAVITDEQSDEKR